MIEATDKLELFLTGFVFAPYYTDTATIDSGNPADEFVDTLRTTLEDYATFLAANVSEPTTEQTAALQAGQFVIAECASIQTADDYSDLSTLQALLDSLKVAAQGLL